LNKDGQALQTRANSSANKGRASVANARQQQRQQAQRHFSKKKFSPRNAGRIKTNSQIVKPA